MDNFVHFGDVAEFRNGLNFSKDSHGKGCLLIGVSDFKDNFKPQYENVNEINPDGVTKKEDYLAKGDLIFVRSNGNKALVGRSMYIDREVKALYSGFCIRSRLISDRIDPLFLAYYAKSKFFRKSISHADGTNINNLNQGILSEVKIPLLDLHIQKRIAESLSYIDKKIELNNKVNAELEAMAKLIYDYWFVQFDFPSDSPQNKGKPYKSSGGKMVYNEELRREIPDGWVVKELSEIANITMGQSPSGSSYNDSGEGAIFFQGSTDFGYRFPSVRKYTTEPSRLAKSGDVLLSVRAPVGTLNIADHDCCIGRGLAALNSKDNADSFLFYVMLYFKQIFDRRNTSGTTFGSITKDDLFSLKLVYPTTDVLNEYDSKVADFNVKIFNNHQQVKELIQLRDWLLPMLMNGQVTVKDV
jgi:type I restriction enzyme S subunit